MRKVRLLYFGNGDFASNERIEDIRITFSEDILVEEITEDSWDHWNVRRLYGISKEPSCVVASLTGSCISRFLGAIPTNDTLREIIT